MDDLLEGLGELALLTAIAIYKSFYFIFIFLLLGSFIKMLIGKSKDLQGRSRYKYKGKYEPDDTMDRSW